MNAPAKIVVRNLVKVFGPRPAVALQVLADGQNVASMSRRDLVDLGRRDMSMVFPSFALMPHRTVLENAAFGLEVAGVAKDQRERRTMQVLEQVGLTAFARKHPAELSGGMQQRVGLARALAVDPSLMLMDEAFSALDPLKRHEMQHVLLDLQRDHKRTIVFVSHDLDEAFRIGDRIAIMEGGSVVQVGDPHEIARNPPTDYVPARFRGANLTRHLTVGDIARADQVPILPVPSTVAAEFGAAIEHLRSIKRHYGFLGDPPHR